MTRSPLALLKEAVEEAVKADDQRAFFLRRFGQALEPLADVALDEELSGTIDGVQSALTDLLERIRAYTK